MSPLLPDEQLVSLESTTTAPASGPPSVGGLEERFHALAAEWKAGRGYSSSIGKMCSHPAYQQVIGMGEKAIPLILRELERAPDHWFWALKAITGVNPVPRDERADIKAMAKHWIEWGREKGYRW
jgi:hypothetical protein